MDTVTLTRAEYQDIIDARDHAIAMRQIEANIMETVAHADVDAYLAAPTPLAFWRGHRGLTQAALAAKIGVAPHSLADAEEGRTDLSAVALLRAARALAVRMEDLVVEDSVED